MPGDLPTRQRVEGTRNRSGFSRRPSWAGDGLRHRDRERGRGPESTLRNCTSDRCRTEQHPATPLRHDNGTPRGLYDCKGRQLLADLSGRAAAGAFELFGVQCEFEALEGGAALRLSRVERSDNRDDRCRATVHQRT